MVKEHDHAFSAHAENFSPVFQGEKTAYIRPDVDGLMEIGHIVQITEIGTERVCEVEITYIDYLTDGMVLLSITLVG